MSGGNRPGSPVAGPGPGEDRKPALGRGDWLDAALKALIRAGVNAVRIDRLASDLGVSRGSFYWHFTNRDELLDELLRLWIETNTKPFLRVLEMNAGEPVTGMLRYCEVWIFNEAFDPAFDAAVRDWARISEPVDAIVRDADRQRIDVLFELFLAAGYEETEALVRARTLYYHQVGYFTLKITQSIEERLTLLPTYFRVLTGFPIPRGWKRSYDAWKRAAVNAASAPD